MSETGLLRRLGVLWTEGCTAARAMAFKAGEIAAALEAEWRVSRNRLVDQPLTVEEQVESHRDL